MQLQGKTAIVTGAGSGIGEAIANRFAAEGARVVTVGRTAAKLEEARRKAADLAERLFPCAADVSKVEDVARMTAFAYDTLGDVDILVNNAGTNVANRSLDRLTPEDFNRMTDINLNGAYLCIHAVLPKMRERKDGLIINVSSIAGIRVSQIAGAGYAASKHGMSALSLAIGLEEGKNGIRSCMICPGEVNTPILEKRPVIPSAERRAQMLQPEDLAQAALLAATLHPRATINELVITPTIAEFS